MIYEWVCQWRNRYDPVSNFTDAPFYEAWKEALRGLGREVGVEIPNLFMHSGYEAERLTQAGMAVEQIVAIARLLDPEHTDHDLRR